MGPEAVTRTHPRGDRARGDTRWGLGLGKVVAGLTLRVAGDVVMPDCVAPSDHVTVQGAVPVCIDWGVLLVALGSVLAAVPVRVGVPLMLSRHGVALIYPSLRDRKVPTLPSPQYAFPDSAGREAALAIVMNDYGKLETVLRTTPGLDLTARDERGESLIGLATRAAVMDGGAMRDLDGLRLLLAAGARPRPDDLGPDQSLIEILVSERSDRHPVALKLLLEAGLSPNTPPHDGRPVLFHPHLAPEAARLLLAHGVDRIARDISSGLLEWSAVTYHASLGRWATALVLMEGGVPPDHGTPPGSALARVIRDVEGRATSEERADAAHKAFIAALRRLPSCDRASLAVDAGRRLSPS